MRNFILGFPVAVPVHQQSAGKENSRGWAQEFIVWNHFEIGMKVTKFSQAKATFVSPHVCGQAAQLSLSKSSGMENTAVKTTAS